MKLRLCLLITAFAFNVCAIGQRPSFDLAFTASDSISYVELDSVRVKNLSTGGDTTLFWPDTVLRLQYHLGIIEQNCRIEKLILFQNHPNPVCDQTTVILYVHKRDRVGIFVCDIMGGKVFSDEMDLEPGYHSFRLIPGNNELLFFTAFSGSERGSIKILAPENRIGTIPRLEYTGFTSVELSHKSDMVMVNSTYSLHDTLLCIGYAGAQQSGIWSCPDTSKTFQFQFATNRPCPGLPSITYEEQVYHTIQINNQCWLKENLNIGTMILGQQDMTDNGILEKYCYNDSLVNCDLWGGFYQWNEMMQYTNPEESPGICPEDWHIPSDLEWKILEGTADSWYKIGDAEWNIAYDWRGHDAGVGLKSSLGWNNLGNGVDLLGFFVPPAGCRFYLGGFVFLGSRAHFWTSSSSNDGAHWARIMGFDYANINRDSHHEENGFSIRCIWDIPLE